MQTCRKLDINMDEAKDASLPQLMQLMFQSLGKFEAETISIAKEKTVQVKEKADRGAEAILVAQEKAEQ